MADDDEMPAFADLGSLGAEALRTLIRTLEDEEHYLSHRRRQLHSQIDILRAEQVNRLRRQQSPAST